MDFLNIDLNEVIIKDPIFNKKNNSFFSEIESSLKGDDCQISFNSQSMKVSKLTRENGHDFVTLEFLDNFPEFFKFIYELDEHIYRCVLTNGEHWFGNKPKPDTIQQLFKRSIILQNDLRSNPSMQFEVLEECELLDSEKDPIKFENLELNNEVKCKLTIKGLEFFENKFYLSFSLEQIVVENDVCQQTEYLFTNSESD